MVSQLWDVKAKEVSPEEYAAIEAEERIIYDTQKAVRALLKRKDLKAADLARLLRVSEARVSQMLGGEARNLTLRTLGRIYHVLGSQCGIAEVGEVASEWTSQTQSARDAHALGASEPKREATRADVARRQLAERVARLAELSDDAAFGSEAIWVFGPGVEPANENDRMRDDDTARTWMTAPLRYGEYERQYAEP